MPSDPRSYPVDPARASARPGQVGDVLSVRLLWFAVISRCSVALSSFLALQSTRLRILVLLNILNSHILSEISDYRSSDIRDKSGSAPRLTKLPFMIDNLVDNAPFRAVEARAASLLISSISTCFRILSNQPHYAIQKRSPAFASV